MKTSRKMGRQPRPGGFAEKAKRFARAYALSLERSGDEYVGTVKELHGVLVRGRTANECEEKALEAAQLAIEALLEEGLTPPVPERDRRAQLNFRLTRDELKLIKHAAAAKGFKNVSDFGRATLLAAVHGLGD